MNDLSKHTNLTVRILAALAECPQSFWSLENLGIGTRVAIRNRLSKLKEAGVITFGLRYKQWRLVS